MYYTLKSTMAEPLLMISLRDQFRFLSLHEEKPSKLINIKNFHSQCIGSSNGWLAFSHPNNSNFLRNPFSNTQLYLPSTDPRIHSKIDKLVLCGDPTTDKNFVVLAMHSDWHRTSIAFCMPARDKKWSHLIGSEIKTCYDVVCCERTKTAFLLGPGPTVEAWDMNAPVPNKKMVINNDQDSADYYPRKLAEAHKMYPRDAYTTRWYLAVSESGEIFVVVRYIGEFVRPYDGKLVRECDTLTDYALEPLVCPYKTVGFEVYKHEGKINKWVEVESLKDRAVFVGGNETTMVELKGSSKGMIYYTDDYWDRMDEDDSYGGHDVGIFNMKDGTIQNVNLEFTQQDKIMPPPFWVTVPHPFIS